MKIIYTSFFKSNGIIAILPMILLHKHEGIRYPYFTIELAWFKYWVNIKFRLKIKNS